MTTKKILYVNGCSMTFGDELGDSKFLPPAKLKVAHDRGTLSPEHVNYMNTHSWGGVLARDLQFPAYRNGAMGGASCQRIVRTTTYDVLELLKTYRPEEIQVIIGWTDFRRYEIKYDNDWRVILMDFIPTRNALHPELKDATLKLDKWSYHDLYTLLEIHFTQIVTLAGFLKSKGVDYTFTYGLLTPTPLIYGREETFDTAGNPRLVQLFEEIMSHPWIFNGATPTTLHEFMEYNTMLSFCGFCDNGNVAHGIGGHPLEKGHWLWAQYLQERLPQKLGVQDV